MKNATPTPISVQIIRTVLTGRYLGKGTSYTSRPPFFASAYLLPPLPSPPFPPSSFPCLCYLYSPPKTHLRRSNHSQPNPTHLILPTNPPRSIILKLQLLLYPGRHSSSPFLNSYNNNNYHRHSPLTTITTDSSFIIPEDFLFSCIFFSHHYYYSLLLFRFHPGRCRYLSLSLTRNKKTISETNVGRCLLNPSATNLFPKSPGKLEFMSIENLKTYGTFALVDLRWSVAYASASCRVLNLETILYRLLTGV